MGKYPDEMIHHICEALWNVNKKHMLKDNQTECKLKERTNHIENIQLRKIFSKPQVGKGIFTALASFVIPALISLITKK